MKFSTLIRMYAVLFSESSFALEMLISFASIIGARP